MKSQCSQCGCVLERQPSLSRPLFARPGSRRAGDGWGKEADALCAQCARQPGLLVRLVLKGFFVGMKIVGMAIMAFTVIRILLRLLIQILWS